ncbi:class I SAM-dependent methyltransferase [Candidatus Dojkabacteria bacterium]|uniref:Class I SAM-dependent methyltransferase n=1 Tax=Candidatus Dojkabacteria bacterium TaxID=2099670 RepID=A0A955RJW7_9BACT|nr:class I SAM-dependent methyltransferase [Candidatus Dojkabacteria bacterium]
MNGSEFKNLQKSHYKDMINTEDIDLRRHTRNHIRKIEAMNTFMNIQEGDSVLEVGVGTGIQAKYLVDHNDVKFDFTGTDLSEDMLQVTRKKFTGMEDRITLEAMDAENMTYDDDSFDHVFVGSTIHHLENPRRGVEEMVRVLKPGGTFCMMEPNYIHPKNMHFSHKYEAEKNMKFMRKKYIRSWLDPLPIKYSIQNFVYAPNGPKFLVPFYTIGEAVVKHLPLLNSMSIMLLVTGIKQPKNT